MMKFLENEILFLQGAKRVHETVYGDKPVELSNMIPLDHQGQFQQDANLFQERVSEKYPNITSFDIWKAALKIHKGTLTTAFIGYTLSEFGTLAYPILLIALVDQMKSQTFPSFWIILSICFFLVLDILVSMMGFRAVGVLASKMKATIYLAIYNRLLTMRFSTIKNNLEGTVLNTLTEFHNILEDKGFHIIRTLVSPLPLIFLSILMIDRLGWWSLSGVISLFLFSFYQLQVTRCNSANLRELGDFKDERASLLAEILSNFNYIKMQQWEQLFYSRVCSVREREKVCFIRYGAGQGLAGITQASFLFSITITIMLVHLMGHQPLTPYMILEIMLLICMLRIPLIYIGYGVGAFFQMNVLMDRVAEIFNSDYTDFSQKTTFFEGNIDGDNKVLGKMKNVVELNNISFSYRNNQEKYLVFQRVNLKLKLGDFVIILGNIGSGKTTLLDCIASQLDISQGEIICHKGVSYMEQEPIVFMGTIRDNIVLDKEMDEEFYQKVLDWCCIREDLDNLERGDMTLIEEKSNVSGGQKARIALARTLYSRKPIVLLDDPIGSLDIKVGQKVVENLYKIGQQFNWLVLMAVNQTSFLKSQDKIFHLQNGSLQQKLTTKQLQILKEEKVIINFPEREELFNLKDHEPMGGESSTPQSLNVTAISPSNLPITKKGLQKESSQTHLVHNFFMYIFESKMNYVLFPLTLLAYFLSQNLVTAILMLMMYNLNPTNALFPGQKSSYFNIIILLVLSEFLLLWLRLFLLKVCIQNSNKNIFKKALKAMLYASLGAEGSSTSGDSLDKFSVDLGVLDVDLINSTNELFQVSFRNVAQLGFIAYIQPVTIIFSLLMVVSSFKLFQLFCQVILPEKKISLFLKSSPLLTQFSEVIKGIKTIHTYKLQNLMNSKIERKIIDSTRASISYHKVLMTYIAYSRHTSNLFLILIFFSLLWGLGNGPVNSDFIYATLLIYDVNRMFYWVPGMAIITSSSLASYQRINLFIQEKEAISEGIDDNQERESFQGQDNSSFAVSIKELSLKYHPDSPSALRNFSLDIKKGMRVAIVGRSGSGKSSLVQALYRIVEPQPETSYKVHGNDALSMPLGQLRGQFCSIPQFPFIFRDTVRYNIDPFDKHSEKEVSQALRRVGLLEKVLKTPKGLDSSVAQKEINLSYGESQLVCLARMLLEQRSIVVMDEANSGIDEKSDEVICEVIRQECRERTVITIAHKLLSIVDYDLIVVLSKGDIVEQGSAKELLKMGKVFLSMVAENKIVHDKVKVSLGLHQ